jgi:hypothetical protein
MIRLVALPTALALIAAGFAPAAAADYSPRRGAPVAAFVDELPFPRTERSQSVRMSDACWKECGAHCNWGIAYCLQHDAQGVCIDKGNSCDRYCQRECRTMGGPFLPID